MNLTLDYDNKPSQSDIELIQNGLDQFNLSQLNQKPQEFAIYLRDDDQVIHGGIFALTFTDSLHIILLWVDEASREQGYGMKLLKAAEDEGIKRKCRFVFVDTFGFQGDKFYKNCGYQCVGKVDDVLLGHPKVFFKKVLAQG